MSNFNEQESSTATTRDEGHATKDARRRVAVAALIVFLLALGVRALCLHDARMEAARVQSSVAEDYRRIGRIMLREGASSFFRPGATLSSPDYLGHPPGYSFLWAFSFALFGESHLPVQIFQIVCDAAAAALLLLIVAELLPLGVAATAGTFAALAPQFVWNSVVPLPDTLAVLPLLLAVYCLCLSARRARIGTTLAAGVCVGLSCWLRANALLLAPFLCLFAPVLFARGRRLKHAASLLSGTLLVVAPLTLRNAVVLGRFVPVSLGAGQTVLEGIADYDRDGRFGIPRTDLAIIRQEADAEGRPEYAGTLFGPDGIERERRRLRRALGVVASHPFWFASVCARRAGSMLRLERARLVAPDPPVSHTLPATETASPVWTQTPQEMLASGVLISPDASAQLSPEGDSLVLACDASKYDAQFASAPAPVRPDTDYVYAVPFKLTRGRVAVEASGAGSGRAYASTVVETVEGRSEDEQPETLLQLPFVSGRDAEIRLTISNSAPAGTRPEVRLGPAALYELGPASHVWTRLPRALIRLLQRPSITAVMLPLSLVGISLLALKRRRRALTLLSAVPLYFLCVQSAVHTEYRYVLAVHHFLLAFAAVTVCAIVAAARAQESVARP